MREARRAIRLEWQMTFGIERMGECVARLSTEGRDFKRTRRRFLASPFDTGQIGKRRGRKLNDRRIAKITRSITISPLCRGGGFFFFFFFRERDREITPFFRDNGTRDRGPVPRTYVRCFH